MIGLTALLIAADGLLEEDVSLFDPTTLSTSKQQSGLYDVKNHRMKVSKSLIMVGTSKS